MDIQEMVNDMRSDELSASQAVDLVEPRSSMTLENVDTLLDAHRTDDGPTSTADDDDPTDGVRHDAHD